LAVPEQQAVVERYRVRCRFGQPSTSMCYGANKWFVLLCRASVLEPLAVGTFSRVSDTLRGLRQPGWRLSVQPGLAHR